MPIITVDSKAIIKVRNDALENAAKLIDRFNGGDLRVVAKLIRDLKKQPVELTMQGKK